MAGLLRLAAAVRSVSSSSCAAHRRHAASAAALVEDYWSEWEEEEEEKRALASAPAAETCPGGDEPRGVQWVVMGRPGPQKHAHAARLAEVLDVPYISMGTLVRQDLSPASQLYKKVRAPFRLRSNSSKDLQFSVQFVPNWAARPYSARLIAGSPGATGGASLNRVP